MVIFVYAFGVREGDIVDLQLKGPSGVIAEQKIALSRTQAQAFRAVGKKRKGQAWPAGTYTGRAALVRNGETIDQSDLSMTLK